ncbi:hypothetical protein BS47DRAFT_1369093 [Hydnum rufescens UP504]|uniref:Uncharacterized protein n=1 Tax=Hydnum rufescens UP504 TaxID=1448309 RepID=A0A9P6ADQ5_9AGAM|nr:hypothetical protein BS47DRAFT_1369093 [Hydnum rufescens UP504]
MAKHLSSPTLWKGAGQENHPSTKVVKLSSSSTLTSYGGDGNYRSGFKGPFSSKLGFEKGLATFVEGSFSCPAPLKTFDCFMARKKRTKPTPDRENWLVVHGPFPQGSSGPVTPRTCPPDMLGAITSWLSYIGLNVVVIMTNSAPHQHAEAFVLAQNDLAVIRNIVGAYDYSRIRQSSRPSPFVAYVYLSKYRSEEELPRDLANVVRHNPSFPAHKYGKLTDPSPSPRIINSISGIPHSMHRHLDCEFFDPPVPPAPLPALPSPPAPSTLPAPTDLPAPAPQTGNPTQAEDPTSVSPVTHPPIVHPPIVHPPIIHPPIVHPPIVHPPIVHPPIVHPPVFILPSFIPPSIFLALHHKLLTQPKQTMTNLRGIGPSPNERTAASSAGGASLTPEEAGIGWVSKGICVVVDSPCSFLHSSASASICSLIDARFWFNSFFFQSKFWCSWVKRRPELFRDNHKWAACIGVQLELFTMDKIFRIVQKSFRKVDEVDPAITVIWLQCNLTVYTNTYIPEPVRAFSL